MPGRQVSPLTGDARRNSAEAQDEKSPRATPCRRGYSTGEKAERKQKRRYADAPAEGTKAGKDTRAPCSAVRKARSRAGEHTPVCNMALSVLSPLEGEPPLIAGTAHHVRRHTSLRTDTCLSQMHRGAPGRTS